MDWLHYFGGWLDSVLFLPLIFPNAKFGIILFVYFSFLISSLIGFLLTISRHCWGRLEKLCGYSLFPNCDNP